MICEAAAYLLPRTTWQRFATIVIVVCVFTPPTATAQAENDVRLVDGPTTHEGRVEIFKGGVWLSVCRSSINPYVGNVICRQLNYTDRGVSLYLGNSYGPAPGETFRDFIFCGANAVSLSGCSFQKWDENCDPVLTLGISCDAGDRENRTLRLVNGPTSYEGWIEVFANGVWGTVTDDSSSYRLVHNAIAAGLACRLLFGSDYGGSVVPKNVASIRYGVVRRRAMLLNNIECKGNERSLLECRHSSPSTSTTNEDSLAVVCHTVPKDCNGYIEATTGHLSSPSYSQGSGYSNDTDCVWKIVNNAARIQLFFTNISNSVSSGTSYNNRLQVLDSNGYTTLYSSEQRPTLVNVLTSSSHEMYVWLKIPSGSKGIQFQASWDVAPCFESLRGSGYIRSPGYPEQYPPNANCTYELIKRKGLLFQINFNTFALGSMTGGLCPDSFQVFDGGSGTSPSIGAPLCGATPAAITTTNVTSTKVTIKFQSDAVNTSIEKGFEVVIRTIEPDPVRPGNYTEDSGSFTSPDYPDVYNGEEDIIWTITTKPYTTITLSFQDVKIAPGSDNWIRVYHNKFRVYNYIYNSGSVSPIVSDGNSLEITFASTLDNAVNRLMASWTTECRQVFQTTTGVITSPTEPDFNSSSADCTYIIRQQPGYYISIQFSAISFEKDQRCRNYIEMRDGSTVLSPLLGERLCGETQTLPPPLNSTQNIVMLTFRTQTGKNYFNLTYTSHPKECGRRSFTENDGTFTSPGFPLGYPSNTYCVWTVTLEKDLLVELTFDVFSVGSQGTECQYAFVRVYNGDKVDAKSVLTTLCGTTLPQKVRSNGSSMTVVLNVFGALVNANGFRATYAGRRSNGGLPRGFFPYRTVTGDRTLGSLLYETVEVPIEDGFPFGDTLREAVYVGTNGVISFQKGTAWPRLDYSSLVVCAYCAYINNVQGVYYHMYNDVSADQQVLAKATAEVQDFTASLFQARTVLVVTWDRVQQNFPSVGIRPSNMGEATFQVALVTDGAVSYALVQYRVNDMTWRYPGHWYTIQMGVAKGSLTSFQPNAYSGTELAYEIDKYLGNTGYKGIWMYELGRVPKDHAQICRDWYQRNKNDTNRQARDAGFARLPKCPCSRRGVFRNVVNQWRFHRRDEENKFECYILNVARTRLFAPLGKECCYSTDWLKQEEVDMLIMTRPLAGASLAFNPLIFDLKDAYETEDRQAHVACCLGSADRLCRRFYQLRPIGECDPNPSWQWSPLYGDPHVTTLDGRQYIFNGLGEFTLATLKTPNVSFTLQARTDRAEFRVGVPTNGTVFTAIGAEENGARIFVQLDPSTNTTLVVYANDVDYTRRFELEGDNFTVDEIAFLITRDNGTCVITFPSEISLQVSLNMKALAIGVSFPLKFQNLTRGLLGNFNGYPADDFVLPDGKVLRANLTEREILKDFSRKWAIDKTNSVMRYEARKGPENYTSSEFEPVFLDELPVAARKEAELVCGGPQNLPCVYDFLATKNSDFSLNTGNQQELSDSLIKQTKNSLPEIKSSAEVYVTVGVPKSIIVTGVDKDVNDTLTYKLVDDAQGALSIDSSTGAMNITLKTLDPVRIQIYAVDSQGGQSIVQSLPLVVCSGCGGHGNCNQSNTRDVSGDSYFQYSVCLCNPAWTGQNCELDKDGCSDNPCHPLQSCTDIVASQQGTSDVGYVCSACPAGYVSLNSTRDCLDVDECANVTFNDCDMLCVNTYGGYECSCQEGYRLSNDGHTCADVNECLEKSHGCQQICNNTEGGYQCECEEGYSYDRLRDLCTADSSVSGVCPGNCTQGCRALLDPAGSSSRPECFCYLGYDLDLSDSKTCVDHDECRDRPCAQVCENTIGRFACSCYPGYMLNKDQRTCSPCPYLKYGPECRETCTCSGRSVECHPVRGCICQDGWTGRICEEDVDECVETPDVCGPHRKCLNTKGSYSCVCREGYTPSDDGGCQDIDECSTENPCGQQEDCTNVPGGYYCTCELGYMKTGSNCTDIDECKLSIADCQQDCVNVPGSFNCECKYGYRLKADRRQCSKVQEVCNNETVCRQTHGCTLDDHNRPLCFCHNGYKLDAAQQTCIDVDECQTGVANCSDECHNEDGSFLCSCPAGKKLNNDGLSCSDCPNGTFGENCLHLCSCGEGAERCDVRTGCECRQGWTGSKCEEDVDECQTSDGGPVCQSQNEECVNFLGGYKCQCHQGFAADNNSVCQDIDECATSNCDQHCSNTVGNFRCTCDPGFSWNETARRCMDIDECSAPDTHNCKQRCDNTAGSYRCSCSVAGYTLNNDGFTCRALTSCQRTDCDTDNGGCASKEDEETCFCNSGYRLLSDGAACARFPGDTTTSLRPQTPIYVRPTGGSTQVRTSWKAVSFTAGAVLMLISLT